MSKRWYVVHAYSGFEKSVQRALIERISRYGMQDFFGQVLVPVEEVVELKSGQKSISERKFFPGYVLVEMEMNDETWHLVKSTAKVTGFVGGTANKPTPISEKEVEKIMQHPLIRMPFGIGAIHRASAQQPHDAMRPRVGMFAPEHVPIAVVQLSHQQRVERVLHDMLSQRTRIARQVVVTAPDDWRNRTMPIVLKHHPHAVDERVAEMPDRRADTGLLPVLRARRRPLRLRARRRQPLDR